MSEQPPQLAEGLQALIARHMGGAARVENIAFAVGGGSNNTYTFDVRQVGGAVLPLVLRQETFGGPYNVFITPDEQFRCLQVTHRHGVPVPRPYFMLQPDDGLGRGFVMEFIAGEAVPRRILRDAPYREVRPRLPAQIGEILATLQRIDAAELEFLGRPAPGQSPAQRELGIWRDRLDAYGEAHPALEWGLRWLEAHAPPAERQVFVHGDFRNGNFIVGPEGIRSVLDWELCHLGDPLEDLGWVCIKAWRYGVNDQAVGGFGPREGLFAAYAARSGAAVDERAAFFWEVFGTFKWAVINVLQAFSHLQLGRRAPVYAACGRNVSMMEYDLLNMIERGEG